MGFDKTITARLWGVTNQITDLRTVTGDSAAAFTGFANPMRGTLCWDRAMYILTGVSVAGGATGGSYTVTVQTDAVTGNTGLPIAQFANIGPLSNSTLIMDNLHQSPGSPLPTHLFIDQTAAGGGIWLQCHALAKKYRGTLGTPGAATSERVLMGNMMRGTSTSSNFGDDRGQTEDTTYTIGTSSTDGGMHRIRLWDSAFFWVRAGNSISGTHDVDIIATVGGSTVSIASTGVGGALNAADERLALANSFYGQCPNPSGIIWTEVTAGGVSDARVIMMAKTGRGSMAKS